MSDKWVLANLMLGDIALGWISIPFRGEVEILLVASCSYVDRDKLRPDGSLGSYTDFTFLTLDWNKTRTLFRVNLFWGFSDRGSERLAHILLKQ